MFFNGELSIGIGIRRKTFLCMTLTFEPMTFKT